jgi:tetratricopeptide (TPR) repeat protein
MLLILQNPQLDELPIRLKGEVHSIEACAGDTFILACHNYAECQLLLFYDDPTAADRAISGAEVLSKASPGVFDIMLETFHRGICLYVAARRTKKRKYKQHAKRIRKQIHKWKNEGVVNVVHYCIFLDAEHTALGGKYEAAETHYKKAIQFVARSGYLHHAGLFNKLYSDFLLRERNDIEEARYHLEEAIRYYTDWGALGVVERLKKSSLLG